MDIHLNEAIFSWVGNNNTAVRLDLKRLIIEIPCKISIIRKSPFGNSTKIVSPSQIKESLK